jgi:predicted GNAT superfamily acetyltransferase
LTIRDAGPVDFPQILALNQQSVDALSPLNESRLQALHADAVYHRVYESAGRAAALAASCTKTCSPSQLGVASASSPVSMTSSL